jgi:hypothetical protein
MNPLRKPILPPQTLQRIEERTNCFSFGNSFHSKLVALFRGDRFPREQRFSSSIRQQHVQNLMALNVRFPNSQDEEEDYEEILQFCR